MPSYAAMQPVFRVIHGISELRNGRLVADPRFKVDRTDFDVARAAHMSEKVLMRGSDDDGIVLCDDVIDDGQMRTVVENDSLFAVMHIQIIRYDVFAHHQTVLEALNCNVIQYVVVILIA